jgi:hypothetical protein
MKMAFFWDVAPFTDVSEVLAASIIRENRRENLKSQRLYSLFFLNSEPQVGSRYSRECCST